MKHYLYSIIIALTLIVSCNTDEPTIRLSSDSDAVTISGNTADILTGPEGNNIAIKIDSPSEWYSETPNAEWCKVTYNKSSLVLSIDKFISEDSERAVSFNISNEDGAYATINVTQTSTEAATLELERDYGSISSRGGQLEIKVESNCPETINYEIINAPVNFLSIEYNKADGKMIISADENITGMNLDAEISVMAGNGFNTISKKLLIRQYSGKMVLKYKTMKEGTVIELPLAGHVDIKVNWGDNKSDEYKKQIIVDDPVNGYITHWYERAGEYEISISGGIEKIFCNGNKRCVDHLMEIVQWGDNGIKSLESAFKGTAITAIPSPDNCSFEYLNNAKSAFEDCKGLRTVAVDIFDYALNISDFSFMFKGCASLEGESPFTLVDGSKIHLYERHNNDMFVAPESYTEAFRGCNKLEDYDKIPGDWK